MPMFMPLFNYDHWYDTYAKNCSLKTNEEWNAEGYKKVYWGILYICMGIISEIIYIPFMFAMLQKETFKNSCYKFMFLLGCIDMVATCWVAIITGILAICGEHFCTNPILYYFSGSVALTAYIMGTCTCTLLALDRFCMMLFPIIAKKLYGGKKILFWLALPFIYGFFFQFTIPVIYNIKIHVYHFDPYIGTDGFEGNEAFYGPHPFILFNSTMAVVIMGTVYSILCIAIWKKPKSLPTITKLQKIMLMQSICICLESWIVAIAYVLNQWYTMPEVIRQIEQIALICTHGDTPIVYLMLNATLRKRFFELVKNFLRRQAKSVKEKTRWPAYRVQPSTITRYENKF